jgi:uncharacterized Zn finger protein (UPF0148 family)
MDGEKVCPICGKRAGFTAARSSKAQPVSASPKSTTAKKPSAKTASKKTASAKPASAKTAKTGWQTAKTENSTKSATPQPIRPTASAPTAKKNKKHSIGCGCLIILLLYVMAAGAVSDAVPNLIDRIDDGISQITGTSYFTDSDTIDFDDWDYDLDDEYDPYWYDSPVTCLIGTWTSEENGEQLTIAEDGTVTFIADGTEYTAEPDSDVFFRVLNLTDSNASDYLSSENLDLIADYPSEDYYYCEFNCYPRDASGETVYEQTLNLFFCIPRELYDSEEEINESGYELPVFYHTDYSGSGYWDTYTLS